MNNKNMKKKIALTNKQELKTIVKEIMEECEKELTVTKKDSFVTTKAIDGKHSDGFPINILPGTVFDYDVCYEKFVTWTEAYSGKEGGDLIAQEPQFSIGDMYALVKNGTFKKI